MYNPHQFDNSANTGPTALAVCLKSMIFLLMVAAIVGLGYWVWWQQQNLLAFPKFKVDDIVWRLNDNGEPNAIGKVGEVLLKSETLLDDDGVLVDPESWHWQYVVFFPADKGESLQLEPELVPASANGEMEYQQAAEKLRNVIIREREMKAGNLREQWEQDGRRQ